MALNVVDSCGWLEYFGDGPNAKFFAPALEDVDRLLVPTIVIFEVCRRVHTLRGEAAVTQVQRFLRQGRLIELDADGLFSAAQLSATHGLAMGDALIYQSARAHSADVWTQDAAFKPLPGVRFIERLAS